MKRDRASGVRSHTTTPPPQKISGRRTRRLTLSLGCAQISAARPWGNHLLVNVKSNCSKNVFKMRLLIWQRFAHVETFPTSGLTFSTIRWNSPGRSGFQILTAFFLPYSISSIYQKCIIALVNKAVLH